MGIFWFKTVFGTGKTVRLLAGNTVIETKVKPFPTCETCPKWKTIECTMSKLLSDTLRNSRHKWAELIYPNSDYFCKDHQDFAGAE